MNLPSEQRSSLRTPMHHLVQFERTPQDDEPAQRGLNQAKCLDISPRGLSMHTDCRLGPNEVLRLYLPVGGTLTPVPIFSEVRWSQPTRQGYRIGLRFLA